MRLPSKPSSLALDSECKVALAIALCLGCNKEAPVTYKAGIQPLTQDGVSAPPAPTKTDSEITREFTIAEPSPHEPVTAAMKLEPSSPTPGAEAELLVYVRIARAHFVHAAKATQQVFAPVEISVSLPPELEAQGDWRYPTAEIDRSGSPVYRNSILLRRPLRVSADADAHTYVVVGEIKCQVCTDEICWPLKRIDLSTSFTIPPLPR
jgi:hypothetical protein